MMARSQWKGRDTRHARVGEVRFQQSHLRGFSRLSIGRMAYQSTSLRNQDFLFLDTGRDGCLRVAKAGAHRLRSPKPVHLAPDVSEPPLAACAICLSLAATQIEMGSRWKQ